MKNSVIFVTAVLLILAGSVGLKSINVAAQLNRPDLPSIKVFPQTPTGGARQDRLIEKRVNSADQSEPIEMTLVRTKKTIRRFGHKFIDDPEWVKGLTVTVKNTSKKTVTYISVQLTFVRPAITENSDEPPLAHSLVFGSKDVEISKRMKLLAPNDSTDLVLSDRSYGALNVALRKLGYSDALNHLQIYLAQVVFNDDTMWTNGYWFKRLPSNPDVWLPIEKEETISRREREMYKGNAFSKIFFWPERLITTTSFISPSQSNCGNPGAPYLTTCAGASSEDCKKEVFPVYAAAPPVFDS